ncbi:transcription antitermination factor NusB [Candidatus Saccharibacteria bacterium]|nr:transcription antitermination factor NusB [Candidatus Saccharibacteria bacterium]MCA9328349.1 transcription antitermination factor NusB [Candidatus Saccharibacteria bacterium]
MASNRHLGRIVALQTLYELDFRIELAEKSLDSEAVLERNINRYSEVMQDKEFVATLVRGVLDSIQELDAFIQPLAPEWPLSQIARIDRVILRMGVWEMQHNDAVPVKVVINEAVELAKGFGADNSSKFVNGVLGSSAKKLGKVSETKTKGAKSKTTSKSKEKADEKTKAN